MSPDSILVMVIVLLSGGLGIVAFGVPYYWGDTTAEYKSEPDSVACSYCGSHPCGCGASTDSEWRQP